MIYWKNRGDLGQRELWPINARRFSRPILPADCLVSVHFNREIAKITGLRRRSSDESRCLLSTFLTSSATQVYEKCLPE